MGINAPINPMMAPSIRNGHLMKLFFAPTKRMISISVLREKMVIRIVLEIRNTATNSKPMMMTSPIVRIVAIVSNNLSAVAPPYST